MPKLQHHAALGKLWKQVYAIPIPLDLDGKSGRLLRIQESKLVGKRDDLLQEIEQLEYASQGWLEEDEIFEWRVQECRSEFEQRFASSKRSGKAKPGTSYANATSSSSRKPITKWITPADKKGPKVAKKKKKMKKGDLFSAMMAASSSEEEDDSNDDGNMQDRGSWQQVGKKQATSNTVPQKSANKAKQKSQPPTKVPETPSQEAEHTQQQTNSTGVGSKKKRNKKKKKGKASNLKDDDDHTGSSENLTSESQASVDQSIFMAILHVMVAILKWLVSLLIAILTWLASLVFGSGSSSKKKGKKKKKS